MSVEAQTNFAPTPAQAVLPPEWQFNHGIVDVSTPEIQKLHAHGQYLGEVATSLVLMEDGSKYAVRDGKPRNQAVDTAIVKSTAYMTHYDKGMNPHHQQTDMEQGFRSILVSRELAWEGPLHQARTAYNMARITKAIIEQDGDVDPMHIETSGISRAAMLAIGMKALTASNPELGLDVIYFNATGPCFPEPLKLGAKDLMHPLRECASMGYHFAKLPGNLLRKYPGTPDLDPDAAIAGYKMLTTGEAGRFVDYIPKESHGYVYGYRHDAMGMGKVWEQKFAEHPGVDVETVGGPLGILTNGHLRIISHFDHNNYAARQERLRDELQAAASYEDVDYQYVSGA
jgi:hypothetical protein